MGGQDLLDRERDPRQLAARGDPRQRSGRLTGIGREAVDDLVDAGGVEGDRVAVELDRRLVAARRAATDGDLEDALREPQLLEDATDLPAQLARGFAASCRQFRRSRRGLDS